MRSVEAYDSEEKTLSSVADMNETRELCYSVTYNGLLYVLGGYTEWIEETQMFNIKSSFECYNSKTNNWTVLLDSMCSNNFDEKAEFEVVASDGWIVVRVDEYGVGSCKFYRYNIDGGTWEYEGTFDRMKANLCLVKKQLILPYPYKSNEAILKEKELLVEGYFDGLSALGPK